MMRECSAVRSVAGSAHAKHLNTTMQLLHCMAAIGNLELRINENVLYASTKYDGFKVYVAIPRLVRFLVPLPSLETYLL